MVWLSTLINRVKKFPSLTEVKSMIIRLKQSYGMQVFYKEDNL